MYYQTIKVVRVNPHSISSEHAIAPLESLGKVEVRVIERESIVKSKRQDVAVRESAKDKPSPRELQKREFKRRILEVLRSHSTPLAVREVSRILKVQEDRYSYQTIQNYLYELIGAGEVVLTERVTRGMKREYFSVVGGSGCE